MDGPGETSAPFIMKIKFLGVVGEDLQEIEMYGYHFVKDKWTEVKDYFAQRKLSNHPHFESKDGPITDVTPVVLPQTIPSVENQLVVKLGDQTVTEGELQAAKDDPMVQESGLVPTYSDVLDSKVPDGNDPKSAKTRTR